MFQARFTLPNGDAIEVMEETSGEPTVVRQVSMIGETLWEADYDTAARTFGALHATLEALDWSPVEGE